MGRLCRFFFLGVLAMAMVYSIRPGFTQTTRQMVERSGGTVEVFIEGQGPRVVMIPSPGRGAEDFADLAGQVSAAGYRVVRPQPRGIGGSRGTLEGITLREIAADVVSVIETLPGQPAFVVGHAFGNRVARMLAGDRPERVRAVILLAAGGESAHGPSHPISLVPPFRPCPAGSRAPGTRPPCLLRTG